ncbi:hypothetical protein [Sediminibacterium sp.]|uniref:hypothetical protein n=1 Tax=Sediminibacterium sp. TaxID=1917865 RepID=UPI0027364D57|nr:hypothetical protein [Sediminibacterium sp.]MDP3567520.1 hypothetical protein [Sediminibacterium sp.]
MRSFILIICCWFFGNLHCQDSIVIPSSSILNTIKIGDSVTYYQCHVEAAVQQLSTVSGQTLTGKQQKYTITEKYVLKKNADNYSVNYYASSLTVFPNRKFSALKIREKPYWEFKKEKSFTLTEKDLKVLLALEKKGKEAIEYDYAISKYNTNQLIIKSGKNFKQLVIDGNYVLSKLIGK